MPANLDYKNALTSLSMALRKMPDEVTAAAKPIMNQLKVKAKKNVEDVLTQHRSRIEKAGYTHMCDDVTATTNEKKTGEIVVVIGGGKKTRWKWHLVDSGTSKMQGTHFIDEALSRTNGDIEAAAAEIERIVLPNEK